MKKLLISLCLFPILCFAAPRKVTPPIKVPIVAAEPEISLEDLRLTIEHIQRLAKEQQTELDKAKVENESIKKDLGEATENHLRAQAAADTLQAQINKVTDDRNEQARLKDSALDQVDVFKVKVDKLNKEIRKLKTIICSEAAILVFFALMWLGAARWFPPYSIGLVLLAPGLVFGAVWFLI